MVYNSGKIKFSLKMDNFQADIDMNTPKDGILALTGKSGSGKSTIAKAICGIIKPDSGEIKIENKILFSSEKNINLAPHLRNIGMVFQEHRLFPHMTVKSNLLYGQRRKKLYNKKLFDQTVKLLDINAILERKIRNLSGGESQRISIGRALLSEPRLLILDEPFSGLDIERKLYILKILKSINNNSNIPIIFISHSVEEIALIANSIALVQNGTIILQGSANELLGNKKASYFNIGSESTIIQCNIIEQNQRDKFTKINANDTEIIISKIPGKIGSSITIRLFAKDISIATQKPNNISINNILDATVLRSYKSTSRGNISLELKAGKNIIIARILESSFKKLKLKNNRKVFALIKSISVVGSSNNI